MSGAQRLVASTVIGGAASVAGGGKFANGAITGAFGYLFNEVAGVFYRKSGLLLLRDLEKGTFAMAKFFSGGYMGSEGISTGSYDILSGTKTLDGQPKFRLEPLDGSYGDDYDQDGRGLYRLHGPGRSAGCITATDSDAWSPVRDLISGTAASSVSVNSYLATKWIWAPSWLRVPIGSESVAKYGTIRVVD